MALPSQYDVDESPNSETVTKRVVCGRRLQGPYLVGEDKYRMTGQLTTDGRTMLNLDSATICLHDPPNTCDRKAHFLTGRHRGMPPYSDTEHVIDRRASPPPPSL
ncbi:hypothetical protein CBL_03088 [Carabus blaptoides fortunei]